VGRNFPSPIEKAHRLYNSLLLPHKPWLTKLTFYWIKITPPVCHQRTCDSINWQRWSCQMTTDCMWSTEGCQLNATVVSAFAITCHTTYHLQKPFDILQQLKVMTIKKHLFITDQFHGTFSFSSLLSLLSLFMSLWFARNTWCYIMCFSWMTEWWTYGTWFKTYRRWSYRFSNFRFRFF